MGTNVYYRVFGKTKGLLRFEPSKLFLAGNEGVMHGWRRLIA
jgi:hypothetical protein